MQIIIQMNAMVSIVSIDDDMTDSEKKFYLRQIGAEDRRREFEHQEYVAALPDIVNSALLQIARGHVLDYEPVRKALTQRAWDFCHDPNQFAELAEVTELQPLNPLEATYNFVNVEWTQYLLGDYVNEEGEELRARIKEQLDILMRDHQLCPSSESMELFLRDILMDIDCAYGAEHFIRFMREKSVPEVAINHWCHLQSESYPPGFVIHDRARDVFLYPDARRPQEKKDASVTPINFTP